MCGFNNFSPDKPKGASLPHSEDHYLTVAQATTDAIITINSESTILMVNPAAEQIFGYSPEEILGRQLTMLMPQYHRRLHREGIARYLATGQRHFEWAAVQLPGLHKNGQEIALEISFLEFNRDGRRFFTGIVRKLRDRNDQALTDARGQQDLFSAIVNQTAVGISVLDTEGRFTFVNERFCQIVGRAHEDLLKISMAVLTHADDLEESLALFERAIADGGSFEVTKRCVRQDGTSVPVHDIVSVLHDTSGQPTGLMTVTLDLTQTDPSNCDWL